MTREGRRPLQAPAILFVLGLVCGCLGPSDAADRPIVQARPVELDGGAIELGRLRFEAGFALSSADARFGACPGSGSHPEARRCSP